MPVKVIIRDNGPIRIEGEVEVFDAKGNKFDLRGRTVLSFCRCGQTANKPFCDSTHKTCGFDSVIVACEMPPMAPPAPKL